MSDWVYLHQGLLCMHGQQTNHWWGMDIGICISLYVPPHAHTPRYLQSWNYCSIPYFFIHMKTREFNHLIYNATFHDITQYITVEVVFLNTMEVTTQSCLQTIMLHNLHILSIFSFILPQIKYSPKLPRDRKGFIIFFQSFQSITEKI